MPSMLLRRWYRPLTLAADTTPPPPTFTSPPTSMSHSPLSPTSTPDFKAQNHSPYRRTSAADPQHRLHRRLRPRPPQHPYRPQTQPSSSSALPQGADLVSNLQSALFQIQPDLRAEPRWIGFTWYTILIAAMNALPCDGVVREEVCEMLAGDCLRTVQDSNGRDEVFVFGDVVRAGAGWIHVGLDGIHDFLDPLRTIQPPLTPTTRINTSVSTYLPDTHRLAYTIKPYSAHCIRQLDLKPSFAAFASRSIETRYTDSYTRLSPACLPSSAAGTLVQSHQIYSPNLLAESIQGTIFDSRQIITDYLSSRYTWCIYEFLLAAASDTWTNFESHSSKAEIIFNQTSLLVFNISVQTPRLRPLVFKYTGYPHISESTPTSSLPNDETMPATPETPDLLRLQNFKTSTSRL
ncbi:hypothetical protein C8R47DRAFT_1229741 [Mycena vitilis]|nr:hypothetical protein C8R47DRAFT_1229741 [Mycena vitilis]